MSSPLPIEDALYEAPQFSIFFYIIHVNMRLSEHLRNSQLLSPLIAPSLLSLFLSLLMDELLILGLLNLLKTEPSIYIDGCDIKNIETSI
jgi:hypothetical protein